MMVANCDTPQPLKFVNANRTSLVVKSLPSISEFLATSKQGRRHELCRKGNSRSQQQRTKVKLHQLALQSALTQAARTTAKWVFMYFNVQSAQQYNCNNSSFIAVISRQPLLSATNFWYERFWQRFQQSTNLPLIATELPPKPRGPWGVYSLTSLTVLQNAASLS